jgi:DedD protein
MASSKSEDTEITLSVGKMLFLFFGLVSLCGVFFGLGYSIGKGPAKPSAADVSQVSTTAAVGTRPSAQKTNEAQNTPSNLTFYKAVGDKDANSQLTTQDSGNPSGMTPPPAGDETKPGAPDPASSFPTNSYFVQVAAVSKQEDADSLVDALKKKQYPAVIASVPTDKLFHVQVGPYIDVKDAEAMRAKLVSDGYNPILKR